MHPCCKKLGKILKKQIYKSIWTTLDQQQQKLPLYANIPILLKDSAYTNINIVYLEDLTKSLMNI